MWSFHVPFWFIWFSIYISKNIGMPSRHKMMGLTGVQLYLTHPDCTGRHSLRLRRKEGGNFYLDIFKFR